MNAAGLNLDERQFHLDEDVIPESFHATEAPYLNHGKSIARNRDGLWFCAFTFNRAFRDRNWLALAVSETACRQGSDFPPPILLVGKDDRHLHPVFEYEGDRVGNSLLLVDTEGRLHVVFEQENGLFQLSADAAGDGHRRRLAQASEWRGPDRVADPGAEFGDATLLPSGEVALYFTREGTLYEGILGGEVTEICEGGLHPNIHVDPEGTRHIAFERDRRISYVRSEDGKTWTDTRGNPEPEMVAYFCSSYPSIATTLDGKLVIAYQGEGKVDLKRNRDFYSRLRPAGGSTISYAVYSDDSWRVQDFLRSSEILLKRRPCSSIPSRPPEFQPFMEELWRPSLSTDKHGVVWMFYLNTTRRHSYFARFLGGGFGDHYEARGAYDCLSRAMFVQKNARHWNEIGTLTLASDQFYFDAHEVPDYSSREARRIAFLDNLEVGEMVGLDHQVGQWQKHPAPIWGRGISGDSPDDDVAWLHVTRKDDGFHMEYMGQGELRSNGMPGRAFSQDGLCWEKREPFDDSKLTLDGEPFPNTFWRPLYLGDPDEADPSRRFKGLCGAYRYEGGVQIRAWDVVASPDGLNWHTVPGLPVVLMGDISCGFHLIRDDEDRDPSRRYKVLLLMGCSSGRAAVVYTSPDLIHWNRLYRLRDDPEQVTSSLAPWATGPIAIDPDAGESPWEEEVHDAVLWRENGLLMFHYDAFYFGANQHIQKALAVSRDGRHYYRVKRGAINMPHGNCGEWDSGRDRADVPIRVGDELWLYFCGMPAGHFSDPDADDPLKIQAKPPSPDENRRFRELRPWKFGMAKLRVDGWAYVQLEREAESGYLTTIPFEYAGGRLVVNGSGLGRDGVRAEVRTPDNRSTVPGFGKEHCQFSDEDSVRAEVTWAGAPELPDGKYRLRFWFEGLRSKLYSFGFE